MLIDSSIKGLKEIACQTKNKKILIFLGMPIKNSGKIYNVAVAIYDGEILAFIPKTYKEFNDCFAKKDEGIEYIEIEGKKIPFTKNIIFTEKDNKKVKVSVEVGKDIFLANSPSISHSQNGANIIVNLASFTCNLRVEKELTQEIVSLTNKLNVSYLLANSGDGESTTDFAFSGYNIIAEKGEILKQSEPFVNGLITAQIDVDYLDNLKTRQIEDLYDKKEYLTIGFSANINQKLQRKYDKLPFIPKGKEEWKRVLEIQAEGLKKRVEHTNAKTLVLGLSGGLDSTLALLVANLTMKKLNRSSKEIIAVTLPCFGTTSRTLENSIKLAKALGVSLKKIDITKSVIRHLKDIGHSGKTFDPAFENAQARERTQVLMDLANMYGGLVVGTGDMSELALGWATYNGDHMSMYGVNAGVTKTLVKHIVNECANSSRGKLKAVLLDILDTPVSPELIPTDEDNSKQKTEDIVGPYILHDFFLYNIVFKGLAVEKVYQIAIVTFEGEFNESIIQKWLAIFVRRFFNMQFKRSCLPDGVAVDKYSLSPRQGFKMPSDAVSSIWQSK